MKSGLANNPVIYVSWYDALRFANWLHNGQPTGAQEAGTTETGAYTFTGATDVRWAQRRGPHLPPDRERVVQGGVLRRGEPATYFDYPTGSERRALVGGAAGSVELGQLLRPRRLHRVTGSTTFDSAFNYLTDVGAYAVSASPYGTFDQGGNVWEWNETASGSFRGVNAAGAGAPPPAASPHRARTSDDPAAEARHRGFRVARAVPEPAQVLLVLTGGLVLAAARRRRRA